MSHLTCPKCGSNEHTEGYGLAVGPMGTYTYCDGCDTLIDFQPDIQGYDTDEAMYIEARTENHLRDVWGDKYKDKP